MKKILVPCDFSEPAVEAFKFAVRIAEQRNVEIHALNVLDLTFVDGTPSLSQTFSFDVNLLKDKETEANAKFQAMWEKHSPLTLPVRFKYAAGSLLGAIETYVREKGIDTIILGTRGHERTGGSNTAMIVRHSTVPVFAIRRAPARQIKKIIVPLMPNQLDLNFCEKVKELQAFFEASLYFVWVNTPRIFKSDLNGMNDLQQAVSMAKFTDYSINIRSDYNVENGIYRFAKETDGDMIAMGTHAWKGFVHFFTGSIAEDIVNHVNLPIWTYALDQHSQVDENIAKKVTEA